MGAQSEWAAGPGLCPRAAIAVGAWMSSLPCGPQLWPFSGLCLSPPCQDSEGEADRDRERQPWGQCPSRGLGLFGPKGACAPPEDSPCFWAMERLGASLDLCTEAPEREGGPTRGGSAGAACLGR